MKISDAPVASKAGKTHTKFRSFIWLFFTHFLMEVLRMIYMRHYTYCNYFNDIDIYNLVLRHQWIVLPIANFDSVQLSFIKGVNCNIFCSIVAAWSCTTTQHGPSLHQATTEKNKKVLSKNRSFYLSIFVKRRWTTCKRWWLAILLFLLLMKGVSWFLIFTGIKVYQDTLIHILFDAIPMIHIIV